MENKETVCAVVVTYNRKNLLIECLEALKRQTRPIQAICLIDNASTDGTPNLLLEKGYIKELPPENLSNPWEKEFEISNLTNGDKIRLYYVRMHENTGGAGGFYEGVKRAYEKGYNWIWVMDDDAEPLENCLELLFINVEKNHSLVVCPLIYGVNTASYQYYHHKIFVSGFFLNEYGIDKFPNLLKKNRVNIDANAFVGPLINRKVVTDVGFPDKRLFIWGDDTEYTYRISRKFPIYLVTQALIKHKDKNIQSGRLEISSYWKYYYLIRNNIYFQGTYNKKWKATIWGIYILFRKGMGIIYYNDDKKVYRLKLLFRAVWDGVRGNLGKRILNKQLKENGEK